VCAYATIFFPPVATRLGLYQLTRNTVFPNDAPAFILQDTWQIWCHWIRRRWKNDTHWFMRQQHLKSSVAVFENTHYSIKSHLQNLLDRPATSRTCRKLIIQNLVVKIYIWYHPVLRQPLYCAVELRQGEDTYTVKLKKLMLQGPSLAWTPSKALGGALEL
jgi:hypothetical protein